MTKFNNTNTLILELGTLFFFFFFPFFFLHDLFVVFWLRDLLLTNMGLCMYPLDDALKRKALHN